MLFKAFELACVAASASALSLSQSSENSLAQLFLEQSTEKKHHCQTTQDRNKAPVDPFYQILMKNEKYSDKDFTPDATSMDWVDMKENELVKYHDTEWHRAQFAFPG